MNSDPYIVIMSQFLSNFKMFWEDINAIVSRTTQRNTITTMEIQIRYPRILQYATGMNTAIKQMVSTSLITNYDPLFNAMVRFISHLQDFANLVNHIGKSVLGEAELGGVLKSIVIDLTNIYNEFKTFLEIRKNTYPMLFANPDLIQIGTWARYGFPNFSVASGAIQSLPSKS